MLRGVGATMMVVSMGVSGGFGRARGKNLRVAALMALLCGPTGRRGRFAGRKGAGRHKQVENEEGVQAQMQVNRAWNRKLITSLIMAPSGVNAS